MFVAVDAIGVLPLFVSLTEGINKAGVKAIIVQSIITASVVALVFLAFGPSLLRFLGISLPDFMIAGGILLLAISLSDLLTGEKRLRQTDPESLGAVPIGVPLITGPAVLTTCILLADIHGKPLTSLAVVVNIILAGLIFSYSDSITNFLGRTGTKTISKIASMLLAAIAVMLIRRGIIDLLPLAQ
ncbi:MarC family protein [Candidatus Sumerlaeota bacterium]|nr:MarC family protein [Candidatus Sumerlaeota bacterium]